MIPDGYTRRVTLREGSLRLRVLYRPATEDERNRLIFESKFLGQGGNSYLLRFMDRHLVAMDSELSLAEIDRDNPKLSQKLCLTMQGRLPDDSGETWQREEAKYIDNLIRGLEFELLHPMLAKRSCESCQKWWYSEETQLVILNPDGSNMERVGPTLCRVVGGRGCPKGTPENQKGLNTANRWAYGHFRDCDAIGVFPDDPIVKRNARLIRDVLQKVERRKLVKK